MLSYSRPPSRVPSRTPFVLIVVVVVLIVLIRAAAIHVKARRGRIPEEGSPESTPAAPVIEPKEWQPVRPAPERFRRDTHMPDTGEGATSGSIDMGTFSPGRDLIYLADSRVWWESDNDAASKDDEDDHSINIAMREPLQRLIELAALQNACIKVQDTYRPNGIHNPRSLHREGRALDVTSNELSLEELAKLCWQAGFDWVFYEHKARGGAHVHCSVRRAPENRVEANNDGPTEYD